MQDDLSLWIDENRGIEPPRPLFLHQSRTDPNLVVAGCLPKDPTGLTLGNCLGAGKSRRMGPTQVHRFRKYNDSGVLGRNLGNPRAGPLQILMAGAAFDPHLHHCQRNHQPEGNKLHPVSQELRRGNLGAPAARQSATRYSSAAG
jgi:hypothetical protein